MVRGTMVLPSSLPVAHEILERIGRLSVVQFVDMQAHALVRPYNNYIQRIDEMERIIRFLHEEIRCLEVATASNKAEEHLPLVVRSAQGEQSFLDNGKGYILDRVEEALSRLYAQFVLFKGNNTNLQSEKNAALEEQCVLQVAIQQLRGGVDFNALYPSGQQSGAPDQGDVEAGRNLLAQPSVDELTALGKAAKSMDNSAVSAVAGMISVSDIPRFQRTLFRSTRGNAFSFFQSVDQKFTDPKTGGDMQKNVFVVYHQGSVQSLLHEKIRKVCDAFNGRCYTWPTTLRAANERLDGEWLHHTTASVWASALKSRTLFSGFIFQGFIVLFGCETQRSRRSSWTRRRPSQRTRIISWEKFRLCWKCREKAVHR